MGAGGLWMPYKCEDPRIDKWSTETLHELSNLAKDVNNPVEIVPTLYLTSSYRSPPKWTKDAKLSFQNLSIEMLSHQNHNLQLRIPSQNELLDAGYSHAWLFHPPVVDAPKMLLVRCK